MPNRTAKLTLSIIIACFLLGCSNEDNNKSQGYIEGRYTYIASSVSGHVKERLVSRGSNVKSGDKLFVLDPEPQEAALQEAEKNLIAEKEKLINLEKGSRDTILNSIRAQVDQAKADLALAKLTLKRRAHLVKTGAVSQAQYDDAQTDYQVKAKALAKLQSDLAEAELGARRHVIREQAARVQASEATIKKLSWELSQKTAYAPVNGVVFDTFFKKGEFVPAGQAILAMLAPKNIYLIFYVPEPLLSSIKVGQQVTMNCDGCKSQTATIYFISPNEEYTPPVIFTKTSRHKLVYRVEAKIPTNEAANFHPGQPIDVTLPGSAHGK